MYIISRELRPEGDVVGNSVHAGYFHFCYAQYMRNVCCEWQFHDLIHCVARRRWSSGDFILPKMFFQWASKIKWNWARREIERNYEGIKFSKKDCSTYWQRKDIHTLRRMSWLSLFIPRCIGHFLTNSLKWLNLNNKKNRCKNEQSNKGSAGMRPAGGYVHFIHRLIHRNCG